MASAELDDGQLDVKRFDEVPAGYSLTCSSSTCLYWNPQQPLYCDPDDLVTAPWPMCSEENAWLALTTDDRIFFRRGDDGWDEHFLAGISKFLEPNNPSPIHLDSLWAFAIDVDKDGEDELVVAVESLRECGLATCWAYLIKHDGADWLIWVDVFVSVAFYQWPDQGPRGIAVPGVPDNETLYCLDGCTGWNGQSLVYCEFSEIVIGPPPACPPGSEFDATPRPR